jgi:hypothetical protein
MAKKTIKTSIRIQATPAKVWQILTDFDRYPNWNPFLKFIKGEVEEGNTIHIHAGSMEFRPMVLAFEAEKEFRWIGNLLLKGLFDGEHSFIIEDLQDGTVNLKHEENFSGLLVGIFPKKLFTKTKEGFNEMNQKLKELAEKH